MAFAISFKRFAFGLRYPISYCAMRFALLFSVSEHLTQFLLCKAAMLAYQFDP